MWARLTRMRQFAALRHRDFRLLWTATLCSSTARWAELVLVGWLTLELTESALMVGIVSASRMAGYVLAPFMGVIADRMDRRRLLIAASVVNSAVSLIMLLLLLTDLLKLWQVIGLALVTSVTWALDNPTRQASMPDLVDGKDLTNAIALNAVASEITIVAGPALGGLLIPVFGLKASYALITGMFLLDLMVLCMMSVRRRTATAAHEPPFAALINGMRYVWRNQIVLVLLVIAFLLNLFGAPYRYAFLPVFARYVLDTGPAGYGMLTSTAGIGALAAGLWLVSHGNLKRKGLLVLLAGLAWSAALLVFAFSTNYQFSLALVFLAGFMQAVTWTLIATMILGNTDQPMRGRVMGLRTGVVVSLPFGNFLAGALAERLGAPMAQGIYGAVAIVLMLVIAAMAPALRKLD